MSLPVTSAKLTMTGITAPTNGMYFYEYAKGPAYPQGLKWHGADTPWGYTCYPCSDQYPVPQQSAGINTANAAGIPVPSYMYFATQATLAFMIDGVNYVVPNIWMGVNMTGAADPSTYFYGNWDNYGFTTTWAPQGKLDQRITVYAWRRGEESDPVVLSFTPEGPVTDNTARAYRVKFEREIVTGSPGDFVDEFNYKLARERLVDPNLDLKLIDDKDPVKTQKMFGHLRLVPGKILADAVEATVIDEELKSNAEKEYVNYTTLRNTTQAPMTLKTSDYQHAIQEAHAISEAWAKKVGVSFAEKINVKFKTDAVIESAEASYESTVSWSTEVTDTTTETITKTDTRTFTVPGQQVVVPPGQAYKVTTTWWRAKISGEVDMLCAITDGVFAEFLPIHSNTVAPAIKVGIDAVTAARTLGLKSLTTERKLKDGTSQSGLFISSRYRFASEIGVLGAVQVDDVLAPPKSELGQAPVVTFTAQVSE